ncbi:MAG: SMI1/KNR4 family protein [Lachnospiraceae bacterium]|nr:SMI1/KNR4 family protein [Lachnospiraceae bacterium]
MAKRTQPAWVSKLRKQLKRAGEKDPDFSRFGADSHKYQLKPPISEETIAAFETRFGISLPEGYRNFLLWMGDGGAGPFYGLDQLKAMEPCQLPDYSGGAVLPLGTQGCTLMTGLVLDGPDQGRVIYYDEDECDLPTVMREPDFLAWYERWIREVIAGYDDEEMYFGLYLDGSPQELMELYEQTEDVQARIEIVESCYKFQTLPSKQKSYFKKACGGEQDPELRMVLIKMLSRFRVPGMVEQIGVLWDFGAYPEAISVICYEGGWEAKEVWWPRVLEKMSCLRGQPFWDACSIFSILKDRPEIHAGLLKDQLYREDLDQNDRNSLFTCLSKLNGREEVLNYFLGYLPDEKNHERMEDHTLIFAIWVTKGIQDPRIARVWEALLDKFRTTQDAQNDYKGSQMHLKSQINPESDCCAGASRPFGVICSNLMSCLDQFGLDYRGSWKLLMDNQRWAEWKQEHGFGA